MAVNIENKPVSESVINSNSLDHIQYLYSWSAIYACNLYTVDI